MKSSPALLSFLLASHAAAAVDFVKDIQPILSERCYQCHGSHKQEAAFRIDHKPSAMKGGDFGIAIVPGKADDSRLMHAVLGTNPKIRMPRKGGPLTADQIAKLKAWIDAGAVWPDSASADIEKNTDHWAFKPPVKPKVPANAKHPIDAFIRTRLEQEGLKPSPPTAPQTLLRRLHLDLTGLPPTPLEITTFTNAYKNDPASSSQHLASTLLASQHYGERWARHWLDAAHYADSNGYEKDPMRFIWFYRDWVISAFNRDLPYDQFIIQQIAGDQLPKASQDQIVATGFLRNTMINEEGGVDPEQFRMEAMFDRMDTIGKSILGLTIGCTQCHNHKYDPITQEEYYRMFAYLNNDNEPWRVVYTSSEQMQRSQILQRVTELEAKLKHDHPDWQQRMNAWSTGIKTAQPQWRTLSFEDDPSGGEKALRQADGSILAQGYAPTKSEVKFVVKLEAPVTISAFRLELMNDPNLPAYGPGRSQKGTAALTEFNVEMKIDGKMTKLKFVKASADFGETENTPLAPFARDQDVSKDKRVTGPVSYAIDGNDKTAWGINAGPGRRNVPRNAVFVLEKPVEVKPDAELTVGLSMKHGGWNSDDLQTMNLGRYRISSTDAPNAAADPLYGKKSEFTAFRATVPEWDPINDEIEAAWKQHPEGTTTLVLDARDQPRMTALLKRGDFTKPGDPVTAGVPAMLNPLPQNADGSRLTFAKWLVSKQSPTAARAFVNRVWQAVFGTGLVETAEDFGTQGSAPSHPELLDWLAVDFMEHNWSTKHLLKLIVTSATYQQSSNVTSQHLERDPYNRLLARGPRFRVEGEVVRDIQLAASGLLNPAVGGRPVMPPAPAHLFEKPASYAPFPWKVEEDANQFRRSVYVFRRRSTPYPFLSTFDVPNGESSCIRRSKSNTPLQALMTLNETTSMAAAQALAQRMLKEGGPDDTTRIAYGFQLCTGRTPSDKETFVLLAMLKRHQSKAGEIDPHTLVARVLLNLDETITKE
ncbi:PSD1 and planctomycete cytochrome C domain-containing protein [Prosthecobacter sp.]|uniref:PSD1 and planctomycete cytochrome C domain-containing protein n=1 Tax=Prosthecobacter sp. TaxID=1965333 RepID=UPI002ABA93C9|nr:PSD1 and planctomycete cytochrome C domain-containing protein [Prosthecobacter sp.]MDZ4401459.1 PSD1 and planctomycete cytochrome C domain-containing protein [Prosthecobacter sp.]